LCDVLKVADRRGDQIQPTHDPILAETNDLSPRTLNLGTQTMPTAEVIELVNAQYLSSS
jgi:hypothetical protein